MNDKNVAKEPRLTFNQMVEFDTVFKKEIEGASIDQLKKLAVQAKMHTANRAIVAKMLMTDSKEPSMEERFSTAALKTSVEQEVGDMGRETLIEYVSHAIRVDMSDSNETNVKLREDLHRRYGNGINGKEKEGDR